jgi:DNA-binding MarR family transcriptional regulator
VRAFLTMFKLLQNTSAHHFGPQQAVIKEALILRSGPPCLSDIARALRLNPSDVACTEH